MAITETDLASTDGTLLTTSAAALLTAPTDATKCYRVLAIRVANSDSADHEVTLGKHTSASDSEARRWWPSVYVAAKSAVTETSADILEGHATTPDLLYGLVDSGGTSGKVAVTVSYMELTVS